jgi:membrane protein DedA with SNARE-associated domain
MHALIKGLVDWYLATLQTGGYGGIVLLMALESTLIPIPSEGIIPPAAYLAYSKGTMSLPGVVIAGILGSWIGATIMYWTARLAGRPLLIRYANNRYVKFIGITQEKIERAEAWSARFGSFGIFASRLLPVVRHLIGIPAGIVRLDYPKFAAYTVAGSAVWCAVLAWVGVVAGRDAALMRGEMREVTVWLLGALGVIASLYYFLVHRFSTKAA